MNNFQYVHTYIIFYPDEHQHVMEATKQVYNFKIQCCLEIFILSTSCFSMYHKYIML